MRTVTFAETKVVDLLNESFVVVWNNHSQERPAPGLQAPYTAAEIAAYPEGGGGNNLVTLIAAPDGTVLNSLPGYWTAETLLQELDFSLRLTKETATARREERLRTLQEQAALMRKAHPQEAGRRIKDSPILRRIAALELLAGNYQPAALQGNQRIESLLVTLAERARVRVFV